MKAPQTANIKTKVNAEIQHIDDFKAIPEALYQAAFARGNTFWSRAYFQMIGETCDKDFEQHWLLYYDSVGTLIAAATFQVFNFSGKNYRFDFNYDGLKSITPEFSKLILKYLIRPFSVKILLQGNAFTTGNISLVCDTEKIKMADWVQKVEQWQWNTFLKKRPDIDVVLWKDFNKKELANFAHLQQKDYLKFEVQPTMTLSIPDSWKSFNDYLGAMQSKYRTRMRKVFKKGKAVKTKWMDSQEIQAQIGKMEELYNQVVAPSNFKMTTLPVEHLWKLMEGNGDSFKVLGFYAPEGLIGFISFYRKHNEMYAGFMGIEREHQFKYDQYLRTLLELIKAGIELDFSQIYFGRTALEIKSSAGAVPEQLFLFAKHRKNIFNTFLKPMVKRLSKQAEWTQRHPFK
ncbi:MAG: hypothetical protein WD334_02735 [Chitinophagales bacterium]